LNIKSILKEWGSNDDWKVREGAIYPIISGLKKNPEKVLEILAKWVNHENEYIRRLVAESLRPKATVKWLRNPEKNDKVLDILTEMRKDPSLYVRKSVGNNIKDLSKYMPEKMLRLMESWLEQANIRVHEQLATEVGLTQEEKRLIWTIKQGMRWIKDKNPEFHDGLEQILGKFYLLYFDEKTNRLAKPPSKK
jgi:3-methyladenine DNA glycosylase AlkC